MSSSTNRGGSGSLRLTIGNTIHNGSVVDKCICSNNVRMRE